MLEHITAFMFDYEHSRVVPTQRDDDDGQEPEKDRTPTKSEINQLQVNYLLFLIELVLELYEVF